MEIIAGKFASATVYTVNNPAWQLDNYARSQIRALCNNPAFQGSRIRVMPDVHAGKVSPIGFTATLGERVLPILTGVDIGCGISVTRITKGKPDWIRLDRVIRDNVPSGFAIRNRPSVFAGEWNGVDLICARHIQKERAELSLGTLGGGNHFIEVAADKSGMYLAVHTGSRRLGEEITRHYLNEGQKALEAQGITEPFETTWITGELRDAWLHDIALAQSFAALNRRIIIQEILRGMKWKAEDIMSTCHNYVDTSEAVMAALGSPLLRKGAASAAVGETVFIPVSMKEGSLMGVGLGDPEWNYSAPHGSGRILPRSEVKQHCTVSAFKKEMAGIYSTCISSATLDEAPAAYRSLEAIREAVTKTVRIERVLTPLYNFKAGSDLKEKSSC